MPVAAGGNLGPAALALPLLPDDGVYVLEMSSYMLERLATLRFDAAAMLNLSADHSIATATWPAMPLAKRAIFARQTGDDLAVIGDRRRRFARHGGLAAMAPAGAGSCASVRRSQRAVADLGAGAARRAQRAERRGGDGDGRFLGASGRRDRAALLSFPGLPHRQQRIVDRSMA